MGGRCLKRSAQVDGTRQQPKDYDTARPRSFAAAGDFTAARNRLPVAVRTRMENNRSNYEFDDSQVFHRHRTAYN